MKKMMLTLLFSVVLSSTAIAEMSDSDKSDKYNSKMFNKSFLKEKGLPYPHWI